MALVGPVITSRLSDSLRRLAGASESRSHGHSLGHSGRARPDGAVAGTRPPLAKCANRPPAKHSSLRSLRLQAVRDVRGATCVPQTAVDGRRFLEMWEKGGRDYRERGGHVCQGESAEGWRICDPTCLFHPDAAG